MLWTLGDADFAITAPPSFLDRAKDFMLKTVFPSAVKQAGGGRIAPEIKADQSRPHSSKATIERRGVGAPIGSEMINTNEPPPNKDAGQLTEIGVLYLRSIVPPPPDVVEEEVEPEPEEEDFSEGW